MIQKIPNKAINIKSGPLFISVLDCFNIFSIHVGVSPQSVWGADAKLVDRRAAKAFIENLRPKILAQFWKMLFKVLDICLFRFSGLSSRETINERSNNI